MSTHSPPPQVDRSKAALPAPAESTVGRYTQRVRARVGVSGWNVLVNSAATVVATVAGLAYQIVLARYLRPEGFGLFSEASAVAILAATIGGFGMNQLAVRELSSGRATSQMLTSVLTASMVGGIVAALGIAAFYNVVDGPASLYVVAVVAAPFTAVVGVLSAPFVSRDAFEVPSAVRAGGVVFFALLAGLGVVTGAPLIYFVASLTVVEIARVLFLAARVRGETHAPSWQKWRGDGRELKMLLSEAAPYGVLALVGMVHLRVDVVMVRWIGGAVEAGLYAGAARFSYSAAILPALLLGVLFPRFVRLRESNEAVSLFLIASKVLFWIGCVVGMISILLSPFIVNLFLGKGYEGSILPLQILMATLSLTFLQSVNGTILASGRRLRGVVVLAIGVTILNIGLNGYLIPYYGASGAAAATLMSEAISVIGYAWMSCNQLAISPWILARALLLPKLTYEERSILLHRT